MPSTSTDRLNGLTTSVAIKAPCRYATTGNITLSGLAVQAGGPWVAPLTAGDRILVMENDDAITNGIYNASASAWARAKDFDGNRDAVQGTIVLVRPASDGTLFYELQTANPVVFGTSEIEFTPADAGVETVLNRLADTSSASNNGALVGLNPTLASASGTVSGRLKSEYSPADAPWLATGDGVTDDRADIAAADTAATAAGKQLRFTAGTYLIGSDITITSQCRFDTGAVLRVATGVTVLFTQPSTEAWATPRRIFECQGTGKVQWLDCEPTVFPEWWVTNATPATTDMTAGLQKAADCVVNGADAYCPSKTTGGAGRCTIILTTRKYRTTAALDWNQRDYMTVIARGKVEILSESTGYIADLSSCYKVRIQGVAFVSYTARVGLLFNRCTSNPYCLENHLEDVNVYVGTNTALNSGQGSIAVVNCRAEQNYWVNCDFRGDVALYQSQNVLASFAPVSGTQDAAIVSLVTGTIVSCNFLRHTKHNYIVIMDQPVGIQFLSCYWATISTATGSNPYAFFWDTHSGCTFTGVMEGTERFAFVSKTCYFTKVNLTPQAAALDSGGIFNFDSSNNTGLVNPELTVNITSAIPSGKLLRWGGGGPSFQLFNAKIITGDSSLIEAASIVATNASVRNLQVDTNEVTPQTVASAASLFIPIGAKRVYVSGTTNITSIIANGHGGNVVDLIFQGALTLTDGSNLKLNGNFVTSADDVISLWCDGTDFYERSRSAN